MEGKLRRLAYRPREDTDGSPGESAAPNGTHQGQALKLPDVKGAGLEIEEQDGSQEAEIAKAGDKKSLCRRP